MKEEFVSYETAKKLKEKGMCNNGNYGYNEKGEICVPVYNLDDDQVKDMCPCPQIHEVLKWLREEKGLHIEIRFDTRGFGACIDKYDIHTLEYISFNPLLSFGFHKSYEEAVIEGIEYVIDNLI